MRARQCDPVNGCGMLYNHSDLQCPACSTREEFSIDMGYDPAHYIYDIECYPWVFTICIYHCADKTHYEYEISYRKNQTAAFMNFLTYVMKQNVVFIGFNNVGYDYLLLHWMIDRYKRFGKIEPNDIYIESDRLISTPWKNRFDNNIWESDYYIKQIDLFKIHHFDNSQKSTSLKQIEFAMRSHDIQDLPFKPGTLLKKNEIDKLIQYNKFDVINTFKFYIESIPMIEFREELSKKYDKSFMNFNDTKIGVDITMHHLGHDLCFDKFGNKRQTPRDFIALKHVIFPYIKFNNPEFNRIKDYLSSQVIKETKGLFEELECTVDGLRYVFGLGGLHASIPGATVHSNHEYIVIDIDVTSYYPSLGIVNRISPEHLGESFYPVVEKLKNERLKYKKGTLENAAYKLAMNSGFGNSNNKYTCFYDPQYTMTITINGQLLLCVLAEWLLTIPDLKIIQCNTDGITYRCKHASLERSREIYHQWEKFTLLDLEEAIYSTMYIRDVNNYIAVYKDGKVKRKGAYDYEKEWHQNQSSLIVAKATEANLLHFKDVREFITGCSDPYDFMIFTKTTNAEVLTVGKTVLQRRSRYYVGNRGGEIKVTRPPTGVLGEYKKNNNTSKEIYNAADNTIHNPKIHTKNESVHDYRISNLEAGWKVTECNNISNFNWDNLNYEYYINETMKLINGVTE